MSTPGLRGPERDEFTAPPTWLSLGCFLLTLAGLAGLGWGLFELVADVMAHAVDGGPLGLP